VTAIPRLITSKNLTFSFCLSLASGASTISPTPSPPRRTTKEGQREKRKEEKKEEETRKEKSREERRGINERKCRLSGTRSYLDEDHLRSLVIR